MTTGRINQVTILNPRKRAGHLPEGRRMRALPCRKGHERSRPAAAVKGARGTRDERRPIQLPPLSFPRDRPRREASGPRAANLRRMCPSSGGGLRKIKPFDGLLSTETYPQAPDLLIVAKPTIHRREKVPAAMRQQGLRSPPQARVQPTESRPLTNIGVNLPEQEAEIGFDPRWLAD